MKITSMSCLIGVFLLLGAARSEAQTTSGTEKAVAALEQRWLQSQKTNNPDLVAPLLADKFVSTSSDGTTWSAVRRIPIDALGSGVDHFLPGLAVAPATQAP